MVWRQASFRQQLLVAFLVMALLPALLLAIVAYVRSRQDVDEIVRQTQSRNMQGAISARNFLDAALQAGIRVVAELHDEPQWLTAPQPALRRHLQQLLADVPLGYDLTLFDRQGRLIAAAGPPGRTTDVVPAYSRPHFTDILNRKGPTISQAFRFAATGEPGLAVLRAVVDASGRPLGVAAVSYNLGAYREQLTGAVTVDGGPSLYVLDQTGHLVFGTGGDRQFVPLQRVTGDLAFQAARGATAGTVGPYRSPLSAHSLMGAYAVVPRAGWVVVVASDYDAVRAETLENVRSSLAILIPASLLALLGALLFSRWYARPVTDLVQMVRGLPQGQPAVPPPSARTAAEFGVLAEAIAETSQELTQIAEALEHGRQDLERALAERTRSLVATNRLISTLAANHDLETACREIVPMVRTLVGSDAVVIRRRDAEAGMLVVQACDPADLACQDQLPLTDTAFGHTVLAGETWIDSDMRPDAAAADAAQLARQGFRSRAVLPVRLRSGEVVATVTLISRQSRAYDGDGLARLAGLEPIIEQLGMAFDRDQLLRTSEQRRLEAENLARLATAFARSVRLDDVAPLVLQTMRTTCGAQRADLWLLNEAMTDADCVAADGELAAAVVGLHMVIAEGTVRRERLDWLAAGKVLVLDSVEEMAFDRQHLQALHVQSGAFMPLIANGRLIGAVFLVYTDPSQHFPTDRMAYAQAIAAQAASAVANATLFDRLDNTLERLQSVQEQLIRSERLSALGQLSSFVSHEIKNRFNVIMTAASLAEMIAGRQGSPERIKSTMATIKKEVDRGNELMLSLLRYAKPKEARRELVDLPAILDSALLTARRANVQIVRRLPADLPRVPGDPASLEQVFLNLILNALQAMPTGGRLTVTATVKPPWLEVAFSDTGVGMSAETRAHLFQPFYTTKAQGTGLGLVIIRQIIDQHKGAIACDSEPGVGTTFTIRLPLATADSAPAPDIGETEPGPGKQAV